MVEPTPELSDPMWYINRDLSHLEFNRRVMQMAQDPTVPLIERLRFLTILSSNLDEFFEVRVAGLQQRKLLDLPMNTPDGLRPEQALRQISDVVHKMIDEQYQMLNDVLLPALMAEDIHLYRRSVWTPEQSVWIREYFLQQTLPVLSPVALDPAHPFPPVQNKGLNFIISLEGRDAFGRESGIAVLQVPRCLPRLLSLPVSIAGPNAFAMISSVIHANVDTLFPGMNVTGCFQFRITRNSNMWVDEEEIDDLLSALKGELHGRNYGRAVRLEVAVNCPEDLVTLLLEKHQLSERDLYSVQGPVNLHRLGALCNAVERPDLKFQPFTPGVPRSLDVNDNIFSQIAQRPVLLFHPYQSFSPVIELLWSAASDPDVLALKMTLYRVGSDSPVIDALIAAARAGKEVTVVVELRARFDEAHNIKLATRLSEAGASVVYGVVGYKCHAKMMLIVRREGSGLRRYVHVGTGNYHAGNARLYTDYSYMTADPLVCEDVHEVFLQLTRMGQLVPLKRLLQSPFTLLQTLIARIDAEAEAARAGKPSRIIARMNSLTEHAVIQALYRASRAGVQIDLIIRGICCLKPGVKGISDNIRVRSIIGRLLEHTRIYYFYAAGEEVIYCSSADWMYRNLHRRVEVACPIEDVSLKARIIEEVLNWGLQDNVQAWLLGPNNRYIRAQPAEGEVAFISQEALIDRLAAHGHRVATQAEDAEQSALAKRKSKSKGKRSGRSSENG
jgi:polyphosphate kinase